MIKPRVISIVFVVGLLPRLFGIASSESKHDQEITTSILLPPPSPSRDEFSRWESCSSRANCTDCTSSLSCHWCDRDGGACHAKGSLGCLVGSSCSPPPPPAPTCMDHKTCDDCSSSSFGCHWCESSGYGACHAIGSIHGCASGVNCHAIHRCQRLEPEPIEDGGGTFSYESFRGVGPVAKIILGLLTGLVLCCSTLCFGLASFFKCAVDDLVGEPIEMVEDGVPVGWGRGGRERRQYYERIDFTSESENDVGRDELEIPLLQNGTLEEVEGAEEDGLTNYQVKLPTTPGLLNGDSILMRSEPPSVAPLSYLLPNRTTPSKGSSIKSMYFGCQLCYLFTIITTMVVFTVGMSYAPRQPEYNVCTNELAWKSIVEGMASIKMSASFDLLISVYNPNRFEVDLSNGHGQFHHDDAYVGSFDIPEGKISPKAISDIVVKVTFTPDKWDALSLTSEYYQGKLKLVLGGHAQVKIPALGDYKFDAKFDDIHVNVNDPSLDDTHLCACPGWKRPFMHDR